MKTRRMSRGIAAEPLRHEEFDALPDELLAFITEQFFGASVHQYNLTLRFEQHDAVGRSFHEKLEPVLRLNALGAVNPRTAVPEQRRIGGMAWRSIIQTPAIGTVTSSQAVFHRERLPCIKGVSINLKTAVEAFAVTALCPAIAKLPLQRAAGKVEPTFVEKGAELVRARHPNHHWRCVGHAAKTSLALAQRFLRPLPSSPLKNQSCDKQ